MISSPMPPPAGAAPVTATQPVQPLRGQSGASLMLFSDGRFSFVRKKAGSVAGNERLRRQANRQRELIGLGIPFPAVLAEGTDAAGLAFFEMAYVPARTLAQMACDCVPMDADAVSVAIVDVLARFRATSDGTVPQKAFRDKIDAIAQHCARDPMYAGLRVPTAAIAGRLSACDWTGVPVSQGHGDMTLENIFLTADRQLMFIDCDDCFASSYWLDAAKLFQDIVGRWCLRRIYCSERRTGPHIVTATQALDKLAPVLMAAIARLDETLARRIFQFTALHLFRTLPYLHEGDMADFVVAQLARVLDLSHEAGG